VNTRTIPKNQWPAFLASFASRHQGWLVSITRNGEHLLADEPLDDARAENATIVIVAGGRELRAENATTIAVTAAGAAGAAIGHVAIATPRGTLTIRFREVIPPELVDGVVP